MANSGLDRLLAKLRSGEVELSDELPIYADDEVASGCSSLSEPVWSWDDTRVIIGTCRDDLRIENRFPNARLQEALLCWDDFRGWMYQLTYSDGRKTMAPFVDLPTDATHNGLVKAMLWILHEHGIECTKRDLDMHIGWIRWVRPVD